MGPDGHSYLPPPFLRTRLSRCVLSPVACFLSYSRGAFPPHPHPHPPSNTTPFSAPTLHLYLSSCHVVRNCIISTLLSRLSVRRQSTMLVQGLFHYYYLYFAQSSGLLANITQKQTTSSTTFLRKTHAPQTLCKNDTQTHTHTHTTRARVLVEQLRCTISASSIPPLFKSAFSAPPHLASTPYPFLLSTHVMCAFSTDVEPSGSQHKKKQKQTKQYQTENKQKTHTCNQKKNKKAKKQTFILQRKKKRVEETGTTITTLRDPFPPHAPLPPHPTFLPDTKYLTM